MMPLFGKASHDFCDQQAIRQKRLHCAEEFLGRNHFNGIGCLLLDVQMPGAKWNRSSGRAKQSRLSYAYHLITGHGNIPMSVQAMKKGAVDFLTKPF